MLKKADLSFLKLPSLLGNQTLVRGTFFAGKFFARKKIPGDGKFFAGAFFARMILRRLILR
jgi:hypothetical protein